MELTLQKVKQSGVEVNRVGELLPKEQFITLFSGDTLILHKDMRPGESALYGEDGKLIAPAHVSCTLAAVFDDVEAGEPIYFDDGKIEGIIEAVSTDEIKVKILHAKDRGSKLKSDKGINLPESKLSVTGLTAKDKEDLNFVAKHADIVNLSFVNKAEDVLDLQSILKRERVFCWDHFKNRDPRGFCQFTYYLISCIAVFASGGNDCERRFGYRNWLEKTLLRSNKKY